MIKKIKSEHARTLLMADKLLERKMLECPPQKGQKPGSYMQETVSTWEEFKVRKDVIDALYAEYDEDSVIRLVNKICDIKSEIKFHIATLKLNNQMQHLNKSITDEEAMAQDAEIDKEKEQLLKNFTI